MLIKRFLYLLSLLFLVGCVSTPSGNSESVSVLNRIKSTGEMRVGFAPYSPYVDVDPATHIPSGYSIDVVNELAKRMGIEVVFVESSWQTFVPDLQTEKYDILAGPLFSTVPRLMEIDFPKPYGYFVGVAALVQENEDRFANPDDLNQAGVTIAVPQGWVAHEWAVQNLPNATIKPFKQEGAALALADVVIGNADVAMADGPSVQQYLEQNPTQPVKALFLENSPVITPAGFGVRKEDPTWLEFLNGSIEVMQTDGTFRRLAKKYQLYSLEMNQQFAPQ